MKKIKIITVVGTRPEIIRLSRVIPALDKNFDHVLMHTGQNFDYELNNIFFKDLNLRLPDIFLNCADEHMTVGQKIGNIISAVDLSLLDIKPDAVLILGDTNSCLAAIPTKRRKIPIFHMEAGNRCFDENVPEEINRKIVDHTSDINLCYSQIARSYLIQEGIRPERIIVTGSPMREVIEFNLKKIEQSKILEKLNLIKSKYFVISAHREENIENAENFKSLINVLNFLGEKYNIPIIVTTHPRTRKKIETKGISLHETVKLMRPFSFSDYICLQKNAHTVLSDSGTISEESSILKFRALNIRQTHERPEAMEQAAVMLVGLNLERIIDGLDALDIINQSNDVTDYLSNDVSQKIIKIIISHIDYVNKYTWQKNKFNN